MPEDKKSKKNGIEKLRKVLDNIHYKDLDSKDEKHIINLKNRLKEPPETKIIYKKTAKISEEEDSLKPTVIIHERKEKRLVVDLETVKKESEPGKESIEFLPEFKIAKKSQIEDEDIFEVEKVDVKVPEFIEVKPKNVIEEDTSDLGVKSAIADEKVAEWDQIDTAEEEVLKEKPIKVEKSEEKLLNFCPYCGTKIVSKVKFCTCCGKNFTIEQVEEEDIPSFTTAENKLEEEKITSEPIREEKVFEEVLEKEKIVGPKEVDLERDEKIETLKELHSIDEETAEILYNAGYTSIDFLKLATFKDLSKIKGIKKKKAKEILKEIEEEPVKLETISAEETNEEKITEEETKLEEEVIPKEVKIEVFSQINCIDNETAILLYDNGIISIDLLKNVTVDDLRKIDGIKKRKAKKIIKELDEKIEDLDKLKRIEIGDNTQNWVNDKEIVDENEIYQEESEKTSPVDLSEKTSEWIPLEEEVDLERDEKIETLKELHSIDEETAEILYNAGYTIDTLRHATIKDLTKVDGIKKKKAKKILKDIEEQSDWKSVSENEFFESDEELIIDEFLEEEATLEQQEKIQIFDDFKNIDEETGTIIFNNGYTTIESLKDLTIKNLKDIGVKKKKAKKILKEIEKKLIPTIEEETFEEYETDAPEEKIDECKEPIIEEEDSIQEEKPENDISEIKAEGIEDPFKEINSIDDKISNLLLENGIESIQDLNNMTIKELTKIKGIKKKAAKKIKKEINENHEKIHEDKEKPFISEGDFEEGDEWESIPEEELKKGPVFNHRDYTLYEKEIFTKSGSKRVVRFFSKGEPEGAKKISLPKGYIVRKNKKTGVPYLKKKK